MKKTIMVSNSWRPEDDAECGICGKTIEYSWGDYSFRFFEKKDKSDLRVICKSCAAKLTDNDKSVRVVNRSPIMDMISLKNSGWKPQPKRHGQGFSGFGLGGVPGRSSVDDGSTKVDPSDEKET